MAFISSQTQIHIYITSQAHNISHTLRHKHNRFNIHLHRSIVVHSPSHVHQVAKKINKLELGWKLSAWWRKKHRPACLRLRWVIRTRRRRLHKGQDIACVRAIIYWKHESKQFAFKLTGLAKTCGGGVNCGACTPVRWPMLCRYAIISANCLACLSRSARSACRSRSAFSVLAARSRSS